MDLREQKIFKVSSEDAWRHHILNNPQPFRRDCAPCLRNGGVGRQHRATPNPRAYVLSVDVAGPLRRKGRSADGKGFRCFLLGAYRFPKQDLEMEKGHPIPEGDVSEGEEPPLPPPVEEPPDAHDDELEMEDGPEEDDEVDPPDPELPTEEEEEERWRRLIEVFKELIAPDTIYFAIPMMGRKTTSVLPALQRMVLDMKTLGFPVTRIHGTEQVNSGPSRSESRFWGEGSSSPTRRVMLLPPMVWQRRA